MNTSPTTTTYDRQSLIDLLRSLPAECLPGHRVVSRRLLSLAPVIARLLGGRVRDIKLVVDADDGDLAQDIPRMLSFLGVTPSLPALSVAEQPADPPDPPDPDDPPPGGKTRPVTTLHVVAAPALPAALAPAPAPHRPQSLGDRIIERQDEITVAELQLLASSRQDRRRLRGYLAAHPYAIAHAFEMHPERVRVLSEDRTPAELASIVMARISAYHRKQRQATTLRQVEAIQQTHAALRASARMQAGRLVLDGSILLSQTMTSPGEGEDWIALGAPSQCVRRQLLSDIARSYVARAVDLQTWIEDGVLHIRHKAGRAGFRLPLHAAPASEGIRMVDLPMAARKAA